MTNPGKIIFSREVFQSFLSSNDVRRNSGHRPRQTAGPTDSPFESYPRCNSLTWWGPDKNLIVRGDNPLTWSTSLDGGSLNIAPAPAAETVTIDRSGATNRLAE